MDPCHNFKVKGKKIVVLDLNITADNLRDPLNFKHSDGYVNNYKPVYVETRTR